MSDINVQINNPTVAVTHNDNINVSQDVRPISAEITEITYAVEVTDTTIAVTLSPTNINVTTNAQGPAGISAYGVWLQNGNTWSEQDFLDSLQGEDWAPWEEWPPWTTDYNELDNVPSTFAPSAHTHDDRYYTESETDTLLGAKVFIADIIDNLTSVLTSQPLSANQGRVLKGYIDAKSELLIDTKGDILSSTPTWETVAYATDTKQFYVFDGTNWQESSSYFGERNANPNMGAVQDGNVNDIGRDFIANKRLSQIKLGGYSEELDSTFKSKGAIKGEDNEDTGDYEMSMWSTVSQTWRRFLAGISLRNDTPNQTLVSDDFSYFTMDLFTGDSLEVDFYGTPMVQWGKISMGAIQPPVTLSGGQF